MLTDRQEERLLDVNPVEALPQRTWDPRRDRPRRPARVQIANEEGTSFLRDMEVFRMRTRPELYEEWQIALIDDSRAALAERLDLHDWDCRVCHTAVMTESLEDPCPRCGAQGIDTLDVHRMTPTQRAEMLARVEKIGASL